MASVLRSLGDNLWLLLAGLFLLGILLQPVHAMPTFFDEEDQRRMQLATENTVSEPTTGKVCIQAIDETEAGWCPTVDSQEAVEDALRHQLEDAE